MSEYLHVQIFSCEQQLASVSARHLLKAGKTKTPTRTTRNSILLKENNNYLMATNLLRTCCNFRLKQRCQKPGPGTGSSPARAMISQRVKKKIAAKSSPLFNKIGCSSQFGHLGSLSWEEQQIFHSIYQVVGEERCKPFSCSFEYGWKKMLKLRVFFFSTSQLTLNIFSCAFECGKNVRG